MSCPHKSSSSSISHCALLKVAGGVALAAAGLGGYFLGRRSAKSAQKPAATKEESLPFGLTGPIDWSNNKVVAKQFVAAFPLVLEPFLAKIRGKYGLGKYEDRVKELFTYTCLGGKMNRGITVVTTTRDLCTELKQPFSNQRIRESMVLGWCLEVLQACFLVADDLMDASVTRRGQPCWYKREDVQMDAVNDALIVESLIFFLIEEHFKSEQQVTFTRMFHEVSLQTQMGQMLDLLGQPQGRKGPEILAKFNLDLVTLIHTFKTAYYSFYVPMAAGMVLLGMDKPEQLKLTQTIAEKMGQKFQIQDDYLDCFADPEHLGKIGTDLIDHKCTWLVCKAKEICTPEQYKTIENHLGKEAQADQDKVKAVYEAINIHEIYQKQEETSQKQILDLIESNKGLVPPCVFMTLLGKIHNRTK